MFKFWKSSWKSSWKSCAQSPVPIQDILAGFTVAAVAVPLNIALAVVCGLPPITGLIAGAMGGLVAGIFGGAPFQVTGPAAALNVMVLTLTVKFGATGVAAACILIGLVQIVLMSVSAGRLVRFVPESVLAGFTTGAGIKILDNQIPEFFGFDYRFLEIATMIHRPDWLHDVSWLAVFCGLFVAFCVTAFKEFKRFPAALLALVIITAISVKLGWQLERVGEIPSTLPPFSLPDLSIGTWFSILIACIPLALLAAIESLLSAQALDRMILAKQPHNANLELFGQGMANLASGFFGGMPVSGVIVRSSVNIQSGAKSRLSSIIHAIILLTSILYLSHLMELIPLSALAGLLCMVGWRLIEIRTLAEIFNHNKLEALAFILAAAGTVSGHLFLGLIAGGLVSFLAQTRTRGAGSNSDDAKDETDEPVATANPLGATGMIRGNVVVDPSAYVSGDTVFVAEEKCAIHLGAHCDIHPGVALRAKFSESLRDDEHLNKIILEPFATVGRNSEIRGFSLIGNHTVIGAGSIIENAVVGSHCFIGIGAMISGVQIPDWKIVPHGFKLISETQIESLPNITKSMDLRSGLMLSPSI